MAKSSTLLVELLELACLTEGKFDDLLHRVGFTRASYSQKGQDRWVIETLSGLRGGYFVEIGGGNGRTHSNTFVLERDFNWQGLIVEANPDLIAKIEKLRKCRIVHACADHEKGEVDFLCLGYLGGIVAPNTDHSETKRAHLLRKYAHRIVRIPALPLSQIFDAAGAPSAIDYLSIDVEGGEYRVLQGFPFDRYRMRALTVERPTPEVHALLDFHGYQLVKSWLYDGFYMAREFAPTQSEPARAFRGMQPKSF